PGDGQRCAAAAAAALAGPAGGGPAAGAAGACGGRGNGLSRRRPGTVPAGSTMSRRKRADAVEVGGGVVGAACALAQARHDLRVELVEASAPRAWSRETPDLRVFALAADNVALLDSLGVWASIRTARAHPYRRMRVWDAAGGDELDFNADAFGRRELGWIVENGLLVDRLSAALPAAGVEVHCPARVAGFDQHDEGVRLTLENGERIEARIAIAADGANSALRRMSGVGTCGRDYGQRGVVGYVQTERPHEDTAWQRLLPGGDRKSTRLNSSHVK